MSISPRLAAESGVITDYDGTRPCIPPLLLAEIAKRALLAARVSKDEANEAEGAR